MIAHLALLLSATRQHRGRHRDRQHLGPGRGHHDRGGQSAHRGVPGEVPSRARLEPPAPRRGSARPPLRQAAQRDAGVSRRDGPLSVHRLPPGNSRDAGARRSRPEDARAWPRSAPTAPTPTSCRPSTPGRPGRSSARALLCVEQAVLVETDPAVAREIARAHTVGLRRLSQLPGQPASPRLHRGGLRRTAGATAWSTPSSPGATRTRSSGRVREHFDAGADHVCVQALARRSPRGARPRRGVPWPRPSVNGRRPWPRARASRAGGAAGAFRRENP